MAQNQNFGISAGSGSILQILGIIYLIKIIRRRREKRHQPTPATGPGTDSAAHP